MRQLILTGEVGNDEFPIEAEVDETDPVVQQVLARQPRTSVGGFTYHPLSEDETRQIIAGTGLEIRGAEQVLTWELVVQQLYVFRQGGT